MELIVIWIISGFIASYIYKNRGRPGIVGFLAGFLLGPLGIILALVTPSNLPKCPYCAEHVRPEAIVCKHCGRDFPAELRASRGQTTAVASWRGPIVFGAVLLGGVILLMLYSFRFLIG